MDHTVRTRHLPSSQAPLRQAFIVTLLAISTPRTVFMGPQLTTAQTTCHQTGARCVALSGPGTAPPTCYGASLGFSYTSLLWVNDSRSLADVTSRLKLWEGLSSVPECWAVVQPFLCSVYMPKCDNRTGRVDYPSLELCEKTREPCRLVEHFAKDWPEFLRCTQPYFKQNCGAGAYDQLNYNTTGRCDWPLVRTENENSWWQGLEGCGVQCQSPLHNESEHRQAHAFVAAMGSLCLISTLFTILTFAIDWNNASRYPALILFFINLCFLLATIGWMAQFSGESARRDIVCRVDGTKRKAEPQLGSGETASCTVVFVMIYYFTMAGLLWFVMLCYAWHVTFRALGTPRDDLSSKTAYFHLVSWSLPLVLTIVCLAISEIDGDPLSGICFVGYHNHSVRAGFVLVPVALVLIVGLFFLLKGLLTLVGIKKDAPDFVGEKATSKITETIIRIGLFSAFALVFGITTFAIHVYIFVYEGQWDDSLNDYLYCLANMTVSESAGSRNGPSSCSIQQTPSLVAMEINMFAFFGAAIIMSSWSWTKASLSAWERFLRKVFRKPSNKPVKLQRHKMIAQAFERRRDLNNGRVSVSFHSTHDDPLGMKLDLHSMSSNMSHISNFAHNVPHLVQRRGGLVHPAAGTLRRYSDSDIASVMSRRFSQGSQQLHDLHGNGHYVYMERDNSSNNGSAAGGWRRRRRRRRKRRKKRNAVQPILGPVLSGMGFGLSKSGGVGGGGGGGGGVRRGSESSILSKASAQGIRMHVENQAFRLGGSLSSLAGGGGGGGGGSERMPMGATASGSDLGKGGGGHHLHPNHLHHSRSRRRKLPRLAPLNKQRHRSLSSSRSSLSLGMSVGGMAAGLQGFPPSHFAQNPYAQLYGGYDYDYAQFYASLGYPPPMAYPFWQPYPYPQFAPPPLPPHPPPLPPHGAGPTTDFSIFAANGSLPGNSSSPEGERKRVVTASTSRRSEVTIETQQTELISLQKVKSGSEFKKPSLPVSDDSIEDLNSSQLDDSGAEDNDNDDDDDDSTAEAEVEV